MTESWRLFQVDKERAEVRERRPAPLRDALLRPAGLTESDDMENWNYVFPASLGTMARKYRTTSRCG